MSEHDQSRKFAGKSAAIANETLEKGKAAAEQSPRAVEQSYSATVEKMRGYNLKMIDMAQANAEAVFELARQLATAKAPSDIAELWTAHARKQFEMLSEQTNELTALGQKIAGESAEPIARSVNELVKLIRKLRWMGLEEAAVRTQDELTLRGVAAADSVVAAPHETD